MDLRLICGSHDITRCGLLFRRKLFLVVPLPAKVQAGSSGGQSSVAVAYPPLAEWKELLLQLDKSLAQLICNFT